MTEMISAKKCFAKHWALLIIAFVLFATSPLLFRIADIPYKDDCDYLLALFEALRKTIVEYGEFPFWYPWCHGGVPLYANSNASIFSIEMLCVLIFGTFYGLRVAIFCYGLAAAFGMFLYLGDFTKNIYARFYGACIFAMSGCFSLHVINGHFVFLGFSFLPILFWFVRRLGKKQWQYAAGTGFMAGMLLNHDIHYTALFSLSAALVMGIPVLLHHFKDRYFWKNVFLAAFVTFAIGGYRMLISADLMLDFPRKIYDGVTVSLRFLIPSLVLPFQEPRWVISATSTLTWDWHEIGCYVGLFSLFLGMYSFIRKWRWYHFAILLTSILTLNSKNCFLPGYWIRKLPAFSSCWVVSRWRFLLVFFLALAAAVGFTCLMRQKAISKTKILVLMFFSVTMLAVNQFWTYGYSVPHKTEEVMSKLPQERPPGKAFVTTALPGFYAGVRHNVGSLLAEEPCLGYCHKGKFRHYPYGYSKYFGEFYSRDAKMTHWSPNRIEFDAWKPTVVRINSNTGNYWHLNGQPLFPDQRAFEEEGVFIFEVAGPGHYVLSAVPSNNTFARTFALFCALLALCMIYGSIRKPKTVPKTGKYAWVNRKGKSSFRTFISGIFKSIWKNRGEKDSF